jgi:hypothetical protein
MYTAGLEATVRERMRQEIEADLWEQMNSGVTSGSHMKEAATIFLRLILGIPADVQRIIEEPSLGGLSMGTKKVLGVVVDRKLWLNFLVVSGVCLSFIIFVIAPIIVAIINRL